MTSDSYKFEMSESGRMFVGPDYMGGAKWNTQVSYQVNFQNPTTIARGVAYKTISLHVS